MQPVKVTEAKTAIAREPTDRPASRGESSEARDAPLVNQQSEEYLAAIAQVREKQHGLSNDVKRVSDYLEETRVLCHILAKMLANVNAAAFEDVCEELVVPEAERTPIFVSKKAQRDY